MTRQAVRFCDGCGQFLDEIQPHNGEDCWIEAHAYLLKYGLRWHDINLMDELCPSCVHVISATEIHRPRPHIEKHFP